MGTNIGNWFSDLGTDIGNWFNDLSTDLSNWFSDLGTNLKTWFSDLGSNLSNFFSDLSTNLGNWFKDVGNWFGELGRNIGDFFDNMLSGIKEFFAGIPEFFKSFWESLKDFFKSLFVPSEERITGLQNTVMSKFDFINSIKTAISSFNDIINNLGNAPVLHLELGSTKYTDKMTVKVIDLNWYKPYKKYGDVVLTGVFYAFYLWRLYNRISDIIRGVGSGAIDVINISEVQGGKR